MGGKQSSNNANTRIIQSYPESNEHTDETPGPSGQAIQTANISGIGPSTSGSRSNGASRARARSISHTLQGLNSSSSGNGAHAGSQDSDSSNEDGILGRYMQAHSLPVHWFAFHGIKCPVCSKSVPPDDIECHLVICLTKPRISYNEEVLSEDVGDECVICFDELSMGDTIARLPCLCIYHKRCIDQWFEINRSCPEHPVD